MTQPIQPKRAQLQIAIMQAEEGAIIQIPGRLPKAVATEAEANAAVDSAVLALKAQIATVFSAE